MDIATIWKLIGLGLEVDLAKKLYTIKLGPLTLKDLSFRAVKALSSQPALIESLLSEHFIQRGVMHVDFRRERVDACIRSLRELQALNQAQAKAFADSGKPEDELFSTLLTAWANECDTAVSILESAIEDERDPINTGMDVTAQAAIPDAIRALRTATYPTIELLIQLLPQSNSVRQQASTILTRGKDLLVRHFGVPFSDLVLPEVEPQ
jgi:hypothetical protein